MTALADSFAERLRGKGKRVRGGKGKYDAQCPAHDDRCESLSVGTGDDGKLLLRCHANCDFSEIVTAAGLEISDTFPPKSVDHQRMNGAPKKVAAWPTLRGAIGTARGNITRHAGGTVEVAGEWIYRSADGREVAAVVRFNLPTPAGEKQKKTFRPFHRVESGWALNDPVGLWPVYRLPELAACKRVVICEGEKAADAAAACGLAATTSAHGAKGAEKTDWGPVAMADQIILIPDHDDAGEEYCERVAEVIRALNPSAVIKRVRLAELAGAGFPKGGDFVDFVTEFRDGQTNESIRAEVEGAAEKLEKSVPQKSAERGDAPILTCLANIERRKVSWLWPNRIPLGRITSLVGIPGVGKSFFTTDAAARVTTGRPWPDGTPCPMGSVIMICAEDNASDTTAPRFDAHNGNPLKVHLLSGVEWRGGGNECREVAFKLSNLGALEESIRRCPDCKLIVIDPVGSYVGGKTDTNSDNQVRDVLAPVAALAEKYGPAVLVVMHRRKATGDNADALALGSRGFVGISRAVHHLSTDPANKHRRLFLPGKNNLAREGDGLAFTIEDEPGRLCWEAEPVRLNADEGLAAENSIDRVKPGPKPQVREAVEVWLRETLAGGEMAAREVLEKAEGAGFKPRTVQDTATAINVVRVKKSFGLGWRWSLPDEGAAKMQTTPRTPHLCISAPSNNNNNKQGLFVSGEQGAEMHSEGDSYAPSTTHDQSMKAGDGNG